MLPLTVLAGTALALSAAASPLAPQPPKTMAEIKRDGHALLFPSLVAPAAPAAPAPVRPLPGASLAYTGFAASCTDIALVRSNASSGLFDQLRARCRDNAGAFHHSRIDLNLCVGIDYTDAALTWAVYGKFSEYCTSCRPAGEGVSMSCACAPLVAEDCPDEDGDDDGITETADANADFDASTKVSVLDLNAGVGNRNGTLACAGGIGTKQ